MEDSYFEKSVESSVVEYKLVHPDCFHQDSEGWELQLCCGDEINIAKIRQEPFADTAIMENFLLYFLPHSV